MQTKYTDIYKYWQKYQTQCSAQKMFNHINLDNKDEDHYTLYNAHTIVFLRSPNISQRSLIVINPTSRTTNSPTHFTLEDKIDIVSLTVY